MSGSSGKLGELSDDAARMSTFCVRAFRSFNIFAPGTAKLCCWTGDVVRENEKAVSVYDVPLEQLWNSAYMRDVRRRMMSGESVPACTYCYEDERVLGVSPRTRSNLEWFPALLRGFGDSVQAAISEAEANEYRMPRGPSSVQLDFGNTCNLACRMCNAAASSRIEADPVHSQWAPRSKDNSLLRVAGGSERTPNGYSRFASAGHWYQQNDFLYRELFRPEEYPRHVYLIGGEPFLIREVHSLLDRLIAMGIAPNIWLGFSTNGTVATPALINQLSQFRHLDIFLSLDGTGGVYEYIRYPAKWEEVAANAQRLCENLGNAKLTVSPTVQAYNVLHITDVFRFADSLGLDFVAPKLTGPRHLEVEVLPIRARELASARILAYVESNCRPEMREVALSVVTRLDAHSARFDEEGLQFFLRFSRELDESRGQSFASSIPELYEFVAPTAAAKNRW